MELYQDINGDAIGISNDDAQLSVVGLGKLESSEMVSIGGEASTKSANKLFIIRIMELFFGSSSGPVF